MHAVLASVSTGYPPLRGRLPTCYSPVRHFPASTPTEVFVPTFTFDLHVLGTPPAFILSQDQTLRNYTKTSLSLPTYDKTLEPLRTLMPHRTQKCIRSRLAFLTSSRYLHPPHTFAPQRRNAATLQHRPGKHTVTYTLSYHSLVVNVPRRSSPRQVPSPSRPRSASLRTPRSDFQDYHTLTNLSNPNQRVSLSAPISLFPGAPRFNPDRRPSSHSRRLTCLYQAQPLNSTIDKSPPANPHRCEFITSAFRSPAKAHTRSSAPSIHPDQIGRR